MAQKAGTGPARFTRRFTDAQKDALLRAHLVGGHTVGQVIRMANAGQLDVPAFEIGTYAYDIIRDGREAFEERDDGALDRAIDAELRRTAALALAHNRALLAKAKRDGTDDPDALRRSAVALSQIKKARRDAGNHGPKPKAPATTPVYTDDPQRETTSVVTSLLDLADRGGHPGSLTDARTGHAAA